jgi:hypothetical protein
MSSRVLRTVVLSVVLVGASTRAGAQTLRGFVMLPDSARVAGAIVIASDDKGTMAARALTGERGDYELRLPGGGHYEVRVLRIGFRPTTVPAFDIANGETRVMPVVLRGEAVVLSRVTVQGKNDCRVRQDSGQAVAVMWEEARKAITATQLSPAGARQTVRWTVYNRATDVTGDIVLSETNDQFSAAAVKAFVSLPPDSLAKVGYMSEERSGTVYRAPDAEALLSDAFASLHCFRVVPSANGSNDWVGIGFLPSRNRGTLVDIEGALWLDRTSSELRLLEFRYTNLPADYSHAEAGGHVEFLRLSTGSWLVGRWQLRMPRTLLHYVPHFTGSLGARDELKPVVEGLQFTGGEVTAVQRGSEVLFSSGQSAHDYSPALLAEDAKLALTCGPDSVDGNLVAMLRGTVFEGAHSPVAGASVRITWRGAYKITGPYSFKYRDEQRDLTSSQSGDWFLCGIPRELLVTVRATIGSRMSAPVTVRIAKDRRLAGVDIELPPQLQ